MSLSIKNRWLDSEDRVYIIFTVEEIAELMNCGTQKAVKLVKELDSSNGTVSYTHLDVYKRQPVPKAYVLMYVNVLSSAATLYLKKTRKKSSVRHKKYAV